MENGTISKNQGHHQLLKIFLTTHDVLSSTTNSYPQYFTCIVTINFHADKNKSIRNNFFILFVHIDKCSHIENRRIQFRFDNSLRESILANDSAFCIHIFMLFLSSVNFASCILLQCDRDNIEIK